MQGAEDKVPGEGRLDGDLRRLMVTNLTHQDNIRSLSHHGAKNALEGQSELMANLRLVDTRQVVLDRVLGGDNLHIRRVQVLQRSVERRRLPGSGRARHQDNSVWLGDQVPDRAELIRAKTQLLEIKGQGGSV